MAQRNTLNNGFCLEGVGIHSGLHNRLEFVPAPPGTGIVFQQKRDDQIISIPASVQASTSQARATRLESNGATVLTPEHLLAALSAYQISDLVITLTSDEIPIFDGSSAIYCDKIAEVGLAATSEEWPELRVDRPIEVSSGDSAVIALPDTGLKYSMLISYDNFIGTQSITWDWDSSRFSTDIAPARTYGFEHEIEHLLAAGLGRGGTLDNALVIGKSEYKSPLRFENELVRHKVLDLIGDLSLVGRPLRGHFVGIRSGHSLNREMALALSLLG